MKRKTEEEDDTDDYQYIYKLLNNDIKIIILQYHYRLKLKDSVMNFYDILKKEKYLLLPKNSIVITIYNITTKEEINHIYKTKFRIVYKYDNKTINQEVPENGIIKSINEIKWNEKETLDIIKIGCLYSNSNYHGFNKVFINFYKCI